MENYYKEYSQFTRKQKEIYDYIMGNSDKICYMTLKELSNNADVSEVLILKVCKLMGFEGFSDLKKALQNKQKLQVCSTKEIEEIARTKLNDESMKSDLLKMILIKGQENIKGMNNNLDMDQIYHSAKLLLDADKVLIFGYNASKIVADYLACRLNYLDIHAFAVTLGDTDAVKSTLLKLSKSDCVVFFSFPPYHEPTKDVLKYAQMRGAKILTITDNMNSPAVATGGCNFICKTEFPFFYNALSVPITFVEILAASVAIELGEKLNRIIKEEQSIGKLIGVD